MTGWKSSVYGVLSVVGVGCCAELQCGKVFLGVILQRLYLLGHLTRAEDEHPGCERVERAGVSDLDTLYSESVGEDETNVCQRPEA